VLLLDKIEAEGFKGGDFLVICDILLETQWMFFIVFSDDFNG
jgi:hypothetical protein